MIKAICKISLASDTSKSVMIHLEIDAGKSEKEITKYTWKVVESSKNGLKLPSSNGIWYPPHYRMEILTIYNRMDGGGIMLYIEDLKEDFWESLVNNKKITSDKATLFNGNPSEEKVTCLLY